ncbi:hypothetical protein C2U54_23975 (plasmid) [Leclercia sp. LSNIH1]|nr:hypothetical protein C2U54_23975 [Leclercia sp. LSNIH1]POV31625.1 hypothetical protein C3388_25910 [Leclercia sp. LSNIH5]POW57415.1 hypothetical protein C3389_25805 [Leclercia sp. LSNIH2]
MTSTLLRPRRRKRPCGLRLTPCLHFSPNAPDARVRFAAILARSQIFTPDVVLPVVLPLRFRGRTVQIDIAIYLRCGLRCRPCIFRSKSGCRVGTA